MAAAQRMVAKFSELWGGGGGGLVEMTYLGDNHRSVFMC